MKGPVWLIELEVNELSQPDQALEQFKARHSVAIGRSLGKPPAVYEIELRDLVLRHHRLLCRNHYRCLTVLAESDVDVAWMQHSGIHVFGF